MSEHPRPSRALPTRPDLRYLKIEAKRRLAAGEFGTLHEAQLTIAREHGLPSWTALKTAVLAVPEPDPALAHVRWVAARFQAADDPTWVTPTADELREHFTDRYLALVPPDTMTATLRPVAAKLRAELVVAETAPASVRARIADLRVEAAAEAEPPHRLTALRMYPLGTSVTDSRVGTPDTRTSGDVPTRAVRVAEESWAELGLPGLLLAGAGGDGAPWTVARGWADLDRPEPLTDGHRFPAYGTTKLITATAVLRLVLAGRVELDGPVNAHLRTIRPAEDDVTVRELLTHTAGVVGPAQRFADEVPDPVALLGNTVPCDGRRGTFAAGNGGYAVLGQLIADVAGAEYPDAVTDLVLRPLGMTDSWFPRRFPDTGAVTGYHLTDGSFTRAPRQVSTMPAAAGLWTTATDLVRFGVGWSTLLSGELRREALRSQAAQQVPGAEVGLGWLVNPARGLCGHPGTGPGGAISLIIRPADDTVVVACTNRLVPIEPVNARLLRPLT